MSEARIRVTTSGLNKAGRGFRSLRTQAAGLGSALAGIGGGLGLAAGAKAILDFDQTLGRLQADSGLSTAKMKELRAQVLSLNSEFAVGKDKITGALQVFQDFGGNIKEGIKILPELTMAAKASGTELSDMATIAAAMVNAGQGPQEVMNQLAQLQNQADAGTISLKDMAGIIPEIFGKGGAKGQTLTGMTSLLQTIGEVTPDAAQARTQILALMRDITKKENLPKLKKMGINPFEIDPKTGKEVVKNVGEIMGQILTATKGKISGKGGLGQIFTDESQGALAALMKSFDLKTGKFGGTFAKMQDVTKKGPKDIFKIKLDRLNKGIDSEGEKFRKTMARMEEGFQNFGKQLLMGAAEDPALALKRAAFAIAAIKFGPTLMAPVAERAAAAIGGALTSKLGPVAARLAGSLGGRAGLLGSALALGYGFGTLLDQQLKWSDWISDKLTKRSASEKTAYDKANVKGSIRQQAKALAGLGASGVKKFGAAGQQKELTKQTAMAALLANAEKQGVTQEEFKKMMPELLKTLKGLEGGLTVNVKGDVLTDPKVDRGPKQ